jgi:hypothetical protein
MDMVLIGGIAVGLVMGSFGYVLVRFGLRPVLAYRNLKTRLATRVNQAAREKALTDEARDGLRRTAMELQDLLDEVLPVWYTMALKKRDEQPHVAIGHLQALVNCQTPDAIRQRAAAVQQSLRL